MTGFQGVQVALALELSQVLPIRDVAHRAFTQLMDFARDLRTFGSDIVVEEDSSNIFGRGRISEPLRSEFKEATKIQKYRPLYNGCEVELHSGAGPTVNRAFQEPRYLATVLTLSMLGYFHGRHDLATFLSFAMNRRFESNLPGSSNSPGYEGIASTLEAISAQTLEFSWATYRASVEEKLRNSIPNYLYDARCFCLNKSVFFGALDLLYIVQRFPEDRKIVISSQAGCVPLVIWAHYILGLTLTIRGSSASEITYGDAEEPQVYITWLNELPNHEDDGAVIRLLDKGMSVIIDPGPLEEKNLGYLGEERHPLRGYGTTHLRRHLNAEELVENEVDMYSEACACATGYALHTSRRLFRCPADEMPTEMPLEDDVSQRIFIEAWRIIDAAALLFDGLPIPASKVSHYADHFSKNALDTESTPMTVLNFDRHSSAVRSFLREIKRLAILVLAFSHVIDLGSCADIPLIMKSYLEYDFEPFMGRQLGDSPENCIFLQPYDIFHLMASLVCNQFNFQDDRSHSDWGRCLSLFSDFGWSVFLSTVGDIDPGCIRPELIHLRKGIPTSAKTRERKMRIRDGIQFSDENCLHDLPIEPSSEFSPRAIARTSRRNEYWTSRLREFELTVDTTLLVSEDLTTYDMPAELSSCFGHRELLNSLWVTHTTQNCSHGFSRSVTGDVRDAEVIRIDSDVQVLLGWSAQSSYISARILVLLTMGERNLRWLAIRTSIRNIAHTQRLPMLRTDDCCVSCAIEYTASMKGKWVLIL